MQAGYRLAEIVARLGGEAVGDDAVAVSRAASLNGAGPKIGITRIQFLRC